MTTKGLFIASTGQNIGKTTVSLGLASGLIKRKKNIGFMKPVGQQHVLIDNQIKVDKDVVLFNHYYPSQSSLSEMSPIIIPSGFTRDYLDGKHQETKLSSKIKESFLKITSNHSYLIAEGTGHVGVGSIIELNNAKIAADLNLDMILIARGGLGSAHDELTLNLAMCQNYKINIKGVVLNQVLEDKREMILHYFPKALKKLGIPLLGCIPYDPLLSCPTIQDFISMFQSQLISGENHLYRHFKEIRLIAESEDVYRKTLTKNTLVICPINRSEIIEFTLNAHQKAFDQGTDFEGGMILTGFDLISPTLLNKIKEIDIPIFHVPLDSFETMKKITSFIPKMQAEDRLKVERAIYLVEKNLNFALLE